MPYTLQTPQTLQEFLAKYAGALDSQGRFIPGKANLEYDGMKAEDVYSLMIGGSPLYDADGNSMGTQPMAAEVNADWIEDPRAKGWIAQHPAGAAIIGTVLGGVGANMAGLLGTGGAAGSAGGFGAGGSSGALGAGGGFGASGASGMWGGATGAAGTAAGASTLPQVTVTAAKEAASAWPSLTNIGKTVAGAIGLPSLTGTSAKNPNDIFTGEGADGVMTNAEAMSYGLKGGDVSTGLLDTAGQWMKDNPTLVKLGGAALGALAGQDSTTSAQKDPWKPAQPYLLQNLKRNAEMQDFYAKNPFSTEQKTAYQGLLDTLANNQANAPVMSGIANSFMGSNRGLLGNLPQFTTGTKAPVVDWSKYQNIGLMGG